MTLPDGTPAESGPVSGTVFSGTDAQEHVRMVSGDVADGALVPDLITDPLGVGPGDTITLDGKVDLRIGAVYESLYNKPRTGYWSPWSEQIYPQCADCPAPPQFILVGTDEAVSLSRALRILAAQGAIRHGRRTVTVVDRTQLRSIVRRGRGTRRRRPE